HSVSIRYTLAIGLSRQIKIQFIMKTKSLKPHYASSKDEPWFDSLRQDVGQMVKLQDRKVKMQMHLKAAALVICYATLYYQLLLQSHSLIEMFCWYILLGICLIILFLNTAHDIAHNTFFSTHKWNERMLMVLDILGDNS